MKKFISILLAVIVTVALGVCLAACGASIDGDYYFSSVTYTLGGVEKTYQIGDTAEGFTQPIDEYFMTIDLKEGSVSYSMRFSDSYGAVAYKGTYERSGNTVKMNLKPQVKDLEEMNVEATVDGDTLTFTDEDGTKYVFVKGED